MSTTCMTSKSTFVRRTNQQNKKRWKLSTLVTIYYSPSKENQHVRKDKDLGWIGQGLSVPKILQGRQIFSTIQKLRMIKKRKIDHVQQQWISIGIHQRIKRFKVIFSELTQMTKRLFLTDQQITLRWLIIEKRKSTKKFQKHLTFIIKTNLNIRRKTAHWLVHSWASKITRLRKWKKILSKKEKWSKSMAKFQCQIKRMSIQLWVHTKIISRINNTKILNTQKYQKDFHIKLSRKIWFNHMITLKSLFKRSHDLISWNHSTW